MGNGKHIGNSLQHSPFRKGKATDKSQWNLRSCSHSDSFSLYLSLAALSLALSAPTNKTARLKVKNFICPL